jgi:signal transduction histidine kinase
MARQVALHMEARYTVLAAARRSSAPPQPLFPRDSMQEDAMPEEPTHLSVLREALLNEIMLASQMRTLQAVQRAYAHDVRGPLNAMQLTLELLCGVMLDAQAAEPAGGAAAWQRHLAVLREELVKLNRTVQALLEQQVPLGSSVQRFQLAGLAREVAHALRGHAAQQRVEIAVEVPPAEILVQGVRDRLRQALLNVAVHALQGVPAAGRLVIGVSQANQSCTLYVEHSGEPLSEQALASLDQLQFTAPDGRALAGLCAARLVARSHGGDLCIHEVSTATGPGERLGLAVQCRVAAVPPTDDVTGDRR